ncbi:hypothetical protein HU200_067048 [Digitaria exilis]|uniref:Uncharacterized protein n=1 Tax=Digitaria exilis TaxID=1010633 RepID=A0A834ZWU5_9POAL|nr:hypothetical protein HU200_067048 [Digitaria exilis]
MILRTPPQRKRRADSEADDADARPRRSQVRRRASAAGRSPVFDRRMVLYDRPTALVPAGAPGEPFEDMVCTYHCRQMVKSEFMVALDTAEKQVQEYRTKTDALEEQLSKSGDQTLIKLLQEELRSYEKEVHEAKRLKSSHTNAELLKEKLLEEQGRRERAEQELSKLQEIEAKAHKLELELASCTALLSNIPDVSSYATYPKSLQNFQKVCISFFSFDVSLPFTDL